MPRSSYIFIGRTFLLASAAVLGLDGALQFASPPAMVEALTHVGFAPDIGPKLAMITLSCALLLAIPKMAIFGAVITTGFLGGAVCAHLRVGELASPPQLICVAIGAGVWIGVVLANPGLASQILGSGPRTE